MSVSFQAVLNVFYLFSWEQSDEYSFVNMGDMIFPTKIFIYEDAQEFYKFVFASYPILFNILLLIATFSPVKLHCCWWSPITIYLVFVGFRDNLFVQNQWNNLLTVSFASRNNACKLEFDIHSVVSSANDNILPLHKFGISFT